MPDGMAIGELIERLRADRTITAAEATRHFGRVQDEVAAGPITLTHHGRARLVMLAPDQYEALVAGTGDDAEAGRGIETAGGFATAFEEMEEGYIALDGEDRFVILNRVAEFHLGRSRDELLGRRWQDVLPIVGDSGLERHIDLVREQGRPARIAWNSAIHRLRRVDIKLFPIPGSLGGVGILFQSIGEIEQLRRRAATTGAMLDVLLTVSPDLALVVLDADGAVVDWRGAAERLLGWSAEEIIGRSGETLLTPADREAGRMWGDIARARREGRSQGRGLRLRRDGSETRVSWTTSMAGGEETLFVCVMRPEGG